MNALIELYRNWRDRPMSPQRRIRRTIAQVATGSIIGFALIYFLISGLVGLAAFNPTSGSDALNGAHDPSVSTWFSETVHNIQVSGGTVRLDAVRSVVYDLKLNRFEAYVDGVMPIPTAFTSDGVTSLFLTQTDRDLGHSWQLLNDVCHKAPAVPADLLKMPSGKDLAAGGRSSWADQSALFEGKPAWQVRFTPSLSVIDQLMLVGFLDRVAPPRSVYALSNGERDALNAGHYTASGTALITKNDRIIAQVDVELAIKSFGSYHILATREANVGSNPLGSFNFGQQRC